MKYIYQDLIEEEILKHKDINVDESTLKNAEIGIGGIAEGWWHLQGDTNGKTYITATSGSVLEVCDKEGNDLAIDFTVYQFDYAEEQKVVCCSLEIM